MGNLSFFHPYAVDFNWFDRYNSGIRLVYERFQEGLRIRKILWAVFIEVSIVKDLRL